MQRRTLFRLGCGGAVLLALTGTSVATWRPGIVGGRLTPAGRSVFEAVGRAVLDGSLPAAAEARQTTIEAHLKRLDDTLAALPRPLQQELSQLLALLSGAPGRLGLAGLRSDWPNASVGELQAALQGMQLSSMSLRQQAYHALRDLTNAAFYADATSWPLMGYSGPRLI